MKIYNKTVVELNKDIFKNSGCYGGYIRISKTRGLKVIPKSMVSTNGAKTLTELLNNEYYFKKMVAFKSSIFFWHHTKKSKNSISQVKR